jgi:hypothetical protein
MSSRQPAPDQQHEDKDVDEHEHEHEHERAVLEGYKLMNETLK